MDAGGASPLPAPLRLVRNGVDSARRPIVCPAAVGHNRPLAPRLEARLMRASLLRKAQPASPVMPHLLQRKCAYDGSMSDRLAWSRCEEGRLGLHRKPIIGSSGDPLEAEADGVAEQVLSAPAQSDFSAVPIGLQRLAAQSSASVEDAPASVDRVLASSGRPLDGATRQDMESRFGHDFSQVRVHDGSAAAQSAHDVRAAAYTVGRDIVFGAGRLAPETNAGRRLLAHELAHVVQQGGSGCAGGDCGNRRSGFSHVRSQVGDHQAAPTLRRKALDLELDREPPATSSSPEEDSEGFEVDPDEFMTLPRPAPVATPKAAGETPPTSELEGSLAVKPCDKPQKMVKIISGKFAGGKTLDDYFPELIGTQTWGANDTAGPFDNGYRAGSSVQLIGYLPSGCTASSSSTTLAQTATMVRARVNGLKATAYGKELEGQTRDDLKWGGWDPSGPPFRQSWENAVSMADAITGAPYKKYKSYENQTKLTSSLTGGGSTVSVDWGITIEASNGTVTKNEVW